MTSPGGVGAAGGRWSGPTQHRHFLPDGRRRFKRTTSQAARRAIRDCRGELSNQRGPGRVRGLRQLLHWLPLQGPVEQRLLGSRERSLSGAV